MANTIYNIESYLSWEKETRKYIYEKYPHKDILTLPGNPSLIMISLYNVRKYVTDSMISTPLTLSTENSLPTKGKPKNFISTFSKPVKNQKAKITRLKNKERANKTNDNNINAGSAGVSENTNSIDSYIEIIIDSMHNIIKNIDGIISEYIAKDKSTFIIAGNDFVSKITFGHHQTSYADYFIEFQCIYGNSYDGVREIYTCEFMKKIFEVVPLHCIYYIPYIISTDKFGIILQDECDENEIVHDIKQVSDWYSLNFDCFCNVNMEYNADIESNVIMISFEKKKNLVYGSYTPEEVESSIVYSKFLKSYCEGIELDQYFSMLESTSDDDAKRKMGWDPSILVNRKNIITESNRTKMRMITETVLNDNTLFKDNRVYNIDDFIDGTQNFLLITGFSGSGKSVLADQIAEELDATVIILDVFHNYKYAKSNYPNDPCVKEITKYLKEKNKKASDLPTDIEQNNFEDEFVPFFKWLIKDLSKKNDKNKYIIEGIHIFLFVPYKNIKNYPLICIETNKYKSIIRRWIRDELNVKDMVLGFKDDIEMYNRHSKIYAGIKSQLDKNPSKDTTSDKHPIFIVTSYTGTIFGKIIKTYTHSTYTHAGISLDTSMEKIYSFNGNNKENILGGFSEEKLSEYTKYNEKSKVKISCMFVKRRDINIIKKKLEYYLNHKRETMYSFSNIWNIIRNKSIEMERDATSMVCSQFVSYLLQQAEIDILDKSSNLITPKDLSSLVNPKLYLLYEGYAKDYDKKKIDRIFKKMKIQVSLIKESMSDIL